MIRRSLRVGNTNETGSRAPSPRSAFTLIELLVVLVIIAVLAALLLPVLRSAHEATGKVACLSNLRQIGAGIALYASENDGKIPAGPKAPPFSSPASFYPSSGAPTSLLSLQNGAPVGLGLILKYLGEPRVLFCPGSDPPLDSESELAKVGKSQAQGSYYYRHTGNTNLFESASFVLPEPRLGTLGDNRNGKPIRALVIDTLFLSPPELASFNVKSRANHHLRFANILFTDGHAVSRENADGRFTVDVKETSQVRASFDKILKVLEQADEEP